MYEPNIVELVRIKYRVLSLLPFSSLISVSTLVLYLAFRVKCIVMFYAASECLTDVLNSVLYFIAELGFFRKLSQMNACPFESTHINSRIVQSRDFSTTSYDALPIMVETERRIFAY